MIQFYWGGYRNGEVRIIWKWQDSKGIRGERNLVNTLLSDLRRRLGGLALRVFSRSLEQVRVRLFMVTTFGGAAGNARSGPIGTIYHLAWLRPNRQGVTGAGNDYCAYHPGCFLNSMVGTLLEIQFLASPVRTPWSRSALYYTYRN